MSNPRNKLTYGQAERLYLLLEELGEAQQIIGKILRHGYNQEGYVNRERLEKELGDVYTAVRMLLDAGDLDEYRLEQRIEIKQEQVKRYLHFQSPTTIAPEQDS